MVACCSHMQYWVEPSLPSHKSGNRFPLRFNFPLEMKVSYSVKRITLAFGNLK